MKKLLCVGCAVVMALAANAAYTPVEWIKASGTQWVNTKYTPACTDKIEMKVKFAKTDTTQALWCSRGSTTVKDTFTSILVSGKVRVDRNNAAGGSVDLAIAAGTDYVITADYNARTATVSDGTTTKELTNLTDGTFTPGSQLSLFVSQTIAGTLTDGAENSQGNWGSYMLYYVKIYNKDGALVREYVPVKDESSSEPRCTVGLYETVKRRFCPSNGTGVLTCGNVTGAADFEAIGGDNEYVLTVNEDTTLDLAEAHVAAAAGKTFVKAGKGTLYVKGGVMKDFPGDIRVRDGYYVVQSKTALGTAEGQTYVEDGGTLVNEVAISQNNGSDCAFMNETIHLKGEGCEGWGALQNKKGCVDFCRNVFLDGPARVWSNQRLDWRGSTVEMNWYPLEIVAPGGGFYLVYPTVAHMGDITCKKGYLEFQAQFYGCLKTATVTLKTGSQLGLWNLSSWLNCNFVLEPDVAIKAANSPFKYAGTDNRNILSGSEIRLQGATKNDLDKNTQYQFRGKLTGDGGIWGGKGGYIQLFNDQCNNDFKGGLDISGVVENGNPVGGVVAYQDYNIPSGADAGPLKLTDASLELRDKTTFHLPDVVASNRVVISNAHKMAACSAKSLKKTGTAELTVFGPLSVEGKAAIDAGALRLVAKVPSCVSGLKWSYRNNNAGINPAKDQGVDATGVAYAYKAWPNGVDMAYSYTGYIRVPGTEGADVKCNWMTSMARGCKVTIGGVVCCEFNDNKNVKDNITVGYDRLAMYKPVTLKAGWQTITVTMNNWYNDTRGPQANTGHGWVANFGIGVDWQNRSVTNTAYYAKLLDPGDGSFLRATLDANARPTYLTESKYRATFAGDVAFGPGTVFDIGDVAPYWPVTVPSLTGLPTVRNGELKVTSSTWTLRASDLVAGATPLTVGANAKVTFPANVTITGDASLLAYKKSVKPRALIAVEPGGTLSATTFTLAPELKAAGFTLTLEAGVPVVGRERGFSVFIK